MGIINNIRSYILEEEFKITILNEKINIVNYTSINHFDSNKVIINHSKGQVIIKGEKLVVTKLMSEEILICGNYSFIEFR